MAERCARVGDQRRGLDCAIDHVEVLRVPHLSLSLSVDAATARKEAEALE